VVVGEFEPKRKLYPLQTYITKWINGLIPKVWWHEPTL